MITVTKKMAGQLGNHKKFDEYATATEAAVLISLVLSFENAVERAE